jgi:hypothetical protein
MMLFYRSVFQSEKLVDRPQVPFLDYSLLNGDKINTELVDYWLNIENIEKYNMIYIS